VPYCYDNRLNPVAYATRSASRTKANYAVTDLEIETVAAVTHFWYYAAVRAMLRAPSSLGKHARWWNKVYGSGIQEVKILVRRMLC